MNSLADICGRKLMRFHLIRRAMKFLKCQTCGRGSNMACIRIFLFSIFILHARESELYRSILDGTSALAWELPFLSCLPHKGGGVLLSALPKDTTSKLAALFSTISPKCRAPSREAVDTIFLKSFGMIRQGN